MLTWIEFPDGARMMGDFAGVLRPGVIIIIDSVEYVVADVGQIASEQLSGSRRYGRARRFMPVVYLKEREVSARS